MILFRISLGLWTSIALAADSEPRMTYVIDGSIDTLSEISLYLYGGQGHVQEMAELNGLKSPDLIWFGQTLKLKVPPTLSDPEGRAKLEAMWARRRGSSGVAPTPSATPSKETAPVTLEPPVRTPPQRTGSPIPQPEPTSVMDPPISPALTSAEDLLRQGEKRLAEGKKAAALELFHRSRTTDPRLIAPWVHEIRILDENGSESEARKVSHQFLESHPNLKVMPFLKKYRE